MEWWGILIIEKTWLQKWNFKMKFQYDSPPSNSIFKRVGIAMMCHDVPWTLCLLCRFQYFQSQLVWVVPLKFALRFCWFCSVCRTVCIRLCLALGLWSALCDNWAHGQVTCQDLRMTGRNPLSKILRTKSTYGSTYGDAQRLTNWQRTELAKHRTDRTMRTEIKQIEMSQMSQMRLKRDETRWTEMKRVIAMVTTKPTCLVFARG